MKRYQLLPTNTVKEKWLQSTNPVGVYIHCPFCKTICKFCVYRGIVNTDNEYYDYYDNYIPKVIDFYRPIIEQKQDLIYSWFFGGGTPSMIDPKRLDILLGSLPGFKESKAEKTIELHPGVYDIGQLDVLKKYNFNNIILCLQTFDEETLNKQNRVPASLETIKYLVKEIRERGFKIGVDIISHMNKEKSDYEILVDDLEKTYTYINPDEISIQTLYQRKNLYKDKTIDALLESRLFKEGNYLFESLHDMSVEDGLRKLHERNKCVRGFNKNLDKLKGRDHYLSKKDPFNFTFFMDPGWWDGLNTKRDVLAIGSYKNPMTQTHSNVGQFNYIESNNGENILRFKYVIDDYNDEISNILEILKKAGPLPKEIDVTFNTSLNMKSEIPFFINHMLSGLNKENPEHVMYVEKFQNLLSEEKKKIIKRLRS